MSLVISCVACGHVSLTDPAPNIGSTEEPNELHEIAASEDSLVIFQPAGYRQVLVVTCDEKNGFQTKLMRIPFGERPLLIKNKRHVFNQDMTLQFPKGIVTEFSTTEGTDGVSAAGSLLEGAGSIVAGAAGFQKATAADPPEGDESKKTSVCGPDGPGVRIISNPGDDTAR